MRTVKAQMIKSVLLKAAKAKGMPLLPKSEYRKAKKMFTSMPHNKKKLFNVV